MSIKTGKIILFTMILCAVSAHAAGQLNVTAAVDQQQIYLFDRLVYQVTVEGAVRSVPEPRVQGLQGFKILGSPQTSSQIQFINGNWSSKLTFTYTLQAVKAGQWVIPPATVQFHGKTYRSNTITVQVIKMAASSATSSDSDTEAIPASRMDDIFLWATVDKATPFVGQPIVVSFDVYTKLQISNYSVQQAPECSGFWVEDLPLPKSPHVVTRMVHGVKYARATVHKMILYPTVTGELVIDPLVMVFEIESKTRDPFDNFFGGSAFGSPFFSRTRKESRSSQALSITVKPLPQKGKPANFSGAVGTFELKALAEKKSVPAGEAVVIKVTLSGNHHLKTLPPPKMPQIPDVKAFEPKAKDVVPVNGRFGWWQRDFEYIFVPHRAGEMHIPSVEFDYFDPDLKQYKILKTKPITITVTHSAVSDSTLVVSTGNGEFRQLGHEIRYIKTKGPIEPQYPAYSRPWFFIILIAPFPIVPIILIYGKHRRNLMDNAAYARAYRAKSDSTNYFRKAVTSLESSDFDSALDDIAKAFAGYLGARLNLPEGSLTLQGIQKELQKVHLPEDLYQSITGYWNTIEAARYAPGSPEKQFIEDMLEKGRLLITQMEKNKFKKRREGKSKR